MPFCFRYVCIGLGPRTYSCTRFGTLGIRIYPRTGRNLSTLASEGTRIASICPSVALNEMPRKGRNLVLCFDGTTNQYVGANTNVVKLCSLLKKDRVEDQITYYQPGIGTYFAPGVVAPLFQWGGQKLDEAFAWYLYQHVQDGYRFLMQNYKAGDKIHLVGFSRGAYTARALAGMLHKVGLLPKDNIEQVPFAYKLFKTLKNEKLAEGFKATFCRAVTIEFLGVWDTVASVGIVMGKSLPFVTGNTAIRVFRHAIALDEHRANFRPNFYHRPVITGGIKESKPAQKTSEGTDESFATDEKEVWFVGCHTDVGGGSTPDTDPNSLANIPLRWMIQEIVRSECGILLDHKAFGKWGIPITIGKDIHPPTSLAANQASGSGNCTDTVGADTEDQADAVDVVQRINDQLERNRWWWIPEILRTSYTYQDVQDNWVTKWDFHLGSGRHVPPNPKFHASVRLRMQDPKSKYKPRARYTDGTETYVT